MLASEFNQELGALIRRLERRVREDPQLVHPMSEDAERHLENAIVALVALYLKLKSQ
jgi:hypothetical protein